MKNVSKIPLPDKLREMCPAVQLCFSPDSSVLYFGTFTSELHRVFLGKGEELELGSSFSASDEEQSTLRDIAVSGRGDSVASIGRNSFIFKEDEKAIRVPRAATGFTSGAFVSGDGREALMVATASRDIHEFDAEGEYTEWSNTAEIPDKWRGYRSKIVAITQHGEGPVILSDNESFTVLDRRQKKSNVLRKIKAGEEVAHFHGWNLD